MTEAAHLELVSEARELGARTEPPSQEMLKLARQRQLAVLALSAAGGSVRAVAAGFDVSAAVIQEQLRRARSAPP